MMEEREEETSPFVAALGEHSVRFHHPAGSVPGLLNLQAERPPHGTAWDLPLPEDGAIRDVDGTYRGHDLPSVESLPELRATLRSNLPARLEQVTLSHWNPGHTHVDAAVAIVGRAAEGSHPRFDRLHVQSTGFAQFFGTRPLRYVKAPGLFDGRTPGEVTVGFEETSDVKWTVDGVEASAGWSTSIGGIGDPFHFEIKSSPWIEMALPEPVPWETWLREWLRPVVDLSSLATGEGQHPTVVEVSRAQDDNSEVERRLSAHVFGSGVRQRPFTVRFSHHRPALFTLARVPYSLNELVARWLELRQRITGFVDAFLPIVRGVRQTPAAELLLLATAAEAIHIARWGEGPTSTEDHRVRRREVLSRLATNASDADFAFLKRHLSRRDRYSLGQRLADLVGDCPAELHNSFGPDELAQRVSQLRNDLAHGRAVCGESTAFATRALRAVLNVQLLLLLDLPLDGVVPHERWRE